MDKTESNSARRSGWAAVLLRSIAALTLCTGLDGCLVIGGSSRGGFFIWPGGLGLLFLIVLFVLLSRRR